MRGLYLSTAGADIPLASTKRRSRLYLLVGTSTFILSPEVSPEWSLSWVGLGASSWGKVGSHIGPLSTS